MKHLIRKFREVLDKEYEIKLPGQRSNKQQYIKKQPPGYVNPFKHQQELAEQRLREIRQQQLETIQRLKEQQELQKRLNELKKSQSTKQTQPAVQVKPARPEPKHNVPPAHAVPAHQPHPAPPPLQEPEKKVYEPPKTEPEQKPHKKEPGLLSKKVEFTIKKPNIKRPSIKLPAIKMPAIKFKKPAIKLPSKPALHKAIKYKKHLAISTAVVVGVTIIGTVSMNINNKPKPQPTEVKSMKIKNPQQADDKKKEIVKSVEKRIPLPTDEEPMLATVDDAEKLKAQDFFKDARNGDKILMFPKNKKAFLYRPETDEVLVQAPLVYKDDEATPSGETVPEQVASDEVIENPDNGPVFTRNDTKDFLHGKTLIEPQE